MEIQTLAQIKVKQAELVQLQKDLSAKCSEHAQVQVGLQASREEQVALQRSIGILSAQSQALKLQIAQDEFIATEASIKIDKLEARAREVISSNTSIVSSLDEKARVMAEYCDTLEPKLIEVENAEKQIVALKEKNAQAISQLQEISEMVAIQRTTYDSLVKSYTDITELIIQRKKDLSKFDELLIKLHL